MQTLIYTTNNAYDTVLLVSDGEIIGRWTVTPTVMADFRAALADPAQAQYWDAYNDEPTIDLDNLSVEDFGRTLAVIGEGVDYPDGAEAFAGRAEFFGS